MQALYLAMFIALAILPISRPRYPKNSALSRGPEELRVTTHPSYREAIAEAKKRSANQKRVVVMPLVIEPDDRALLATSLQMELIRDLQHLSDITVVDFLTFRHSLGGTLPRVAQDAASRAAEAVAAEIVVSGTIEVTGGKFVATLQSHDVRQSGKPFVVKIESTPADFFSMSNKIAESLLAEWNVSPSDAQRKSMFATPTTVESARLSCDRAMLTLIDWNTKDAPGEGPGKLEEALEHAQAAIKADPNYLRAYLAAASIAEALPDNPSQRDRFLKAGRNRIRPSTAVEQRAVLELEADYAIFVKNDRIEARQKYSEILALCPNDPLALWKNIELVAEKPEGQSLSADDEKQAVRYAAQFQSAHPHSPLSKLLAGTN
jgi:TolB-like protein